MNGFSLRNLLRLSSVKLDFNPFWLRIRRSVERHVLLNNFLSRYEKWIDYVVANYTDSGEVARPGLIAAHELRLVLI